MDDRILLGRVRLGYSNEFVVLPFGKEVSEVVM